MKTLESPSSTNFEKLSEDEKALKAYGYALQHAQSFLFSTNNADLPLEQYHNELKALIDWLAKKLGMEWANGHLY